MMMKSKVSERPLFSETIPMDDVENVGIMQGFMDGEYDEDDGDDDEDFQAEKMMGRQPNSPEILMNNLRGDMRSIDARVEELADLVGFNAAAETPQDVLALLQPVFAAQQAPAMPQAMPQGGIPQEGMPPEMMGGMPPEMMGGMPPEMPQEMPQEMPPEMMEGIGALAADQGPGMAEPVMMAKGGPVQSFRIGSNEDGVTPIDDDTSSLEEMFALMGGDPSLMGGGAPSPDEVAAARQRQLARAGQQALPVPDLKSEVERRTPMYEELMGVDRDLSQAQILFELGQRAFNFGANVDDQGRPLRGSAAARLAGAVRTLPGSIGQITGQMDQQRRAVRGAALQASERNIENMLLNRTRTDVAQTQADARTIASAAKIEADKNKPTTRKANWDIDNQLIPGRAEAFAKGQLTPDQDNEFIAAAMSTFKPKQEEYTDDQGRKVTKTIPGLEFLSTVDALKARGMYDTIKTALREGGVGMGSAGKPVTPSPVIPQESAQSFTDEPPVLLEGPPGSQELKRQQQIGSQYKQLQSDLVAGKIKKPEYDNRIGALNAESMRIKNVLEKKRQSQGAATPSAEAPASFSGATYFDSIEGAFGLAAGGARLIAENIPLDAAGRIAPGKQQDSAVINTLAEEIINPLRDSKTFSNPELNRIAENANLQASAFKSADAARNNAIALARNLYGLRKDAQAKASDLSLANTVTNAERAKAVALTNAINKLGVPPPVSTQGEFDAIPSGSRFLVYDTDKASWTVKSKP